MAKLLSEQFRKNIEKSGMTDDVLAGLYDAVKNMPDEDFKAYMFVNKDYFKRNIPAAVKEIDGFQSLVTIEPDWGSSNINYDEVTGSIGALDKFHEYDMNDFDVFGAKVGMTGNSFMKQMAKDKIALDRKRIAHGEDLGGWFESPKSFAHNLGGAFMNVMAPRTQESIERGEEPGLKEYALDIGSAAAQTLPVGSIFKVSNAYKPLSLRSILANASVPAAIEAVESVVYDEDNQRSEFDPFDVAKGAAVNIAMPRGLKRFGAEKWDDFGKNISTKNVPGLKLILSKGPKGTISDIVTNKTGDVIYANKATPLPFAGQKLEEGQKKKKIQQEKQKKKESAIRKFLINENEEK